MMRAPETQVVRWFRYCASRTIARPSRPQRGFSRNTLRMIAVLRYRGSHRRKRVEKRGTILLQSDFGEYCFSFGLFSPSFAQGLGPEVDEQAVEAGGGLGRCLAA